jgi:type IV pilus assembly protein PilY1
VTNTWWRASTTLKDQIDPVVQGVAEPWMLEAHRRVVTLTGSAGPGVAFRRANLTTAQQNSLASTALQQNKLVSYLRGGNTYTDPNPPNTVYPIEGTGVGQFRQRFGVLGDLANAEPVIVIPPDRNYLDGTDPGYSTFKSTYNPPRPATTRGSYVVAPANDGMVHVFATGPMPRPAYGALPAIPTTAGGGTEIFAFIPKALFRGVAGNPATEDITAIQALSYQDGGVPIYHHHFYVDSSPRVADVDFNNGATPSWHTIVVGGLGKGGNSYYALDVTNLDSVPDETTAASKVLWEWSDPEVRYTYGHPVIVKVRETGYPTGRWVVIVTGGYNNVSGRGKLFFLDAATGTLLSTITTAAGTATDPSGFAQIHAFVQNENNQTAEQIYGGDLLGNLWRIDVSAPDSYKTAPAVLLAQLTAPDGTPQPVTTAPQIEIDVNNGVDRYVFIGTGRLLDNTDLTSPATPQTQTMYAIRDGSLLTFSTSGLPIQPRSTLASVATDACDPLAGGAPNGWFNDLPNTSGPPPDSERIVVDVQANVNIVQYIGTKVQDDVCLISLPAVLYARDYTTAKSLLRDPGVRVGGALPSDPIGNACVSGSAATGNGIVASITLPNGAVGSITIGRVQPDGSQSLGALISGEVPGTTPLDLQNPVIGPGNRLSWRLLGAE